MKLSVSNSELSFFESDDEGERRSRSNALVLNTKQKKENSTSPHSNIHKNSFDKISPKKKSSKSVNDKKRGKEGETKSRKEIWMDKCGAKRLMDSNPGYYQSMKDNFLEYPNPSFHQIDLDLKRTFPENKEQFPPEKIEQMR